MAEALDRGTFGEQGMGFFLGSKGYFFVDGPSGTQGHAANAPGFDGVAYNIKLDDLIVCDNKCFASSSNIGSGTAIDPAVRLAKNLDDFIARVQNMPDLPAQSRILELLRNTQISITSSGVNPPPNVRIAITNFGGNSERLTKAFAGRGIKFIDMNSVPVAPAPASRTYINQQTIPSMAQSADTGAAAYNARRARVGAAAEGARAVAQAANDHALTFAIERELKRLTAPIGEAIARGGGALVILNITSTMPRGNVGMVNSRSLTSARIVAHPNTHRQEAVELWESQDKIGPSYPAYIIPETRLLWIAVPAVP